MEKKKIITTKKKVIRFKKKPVYILLSIIALIILAALALIFRGKLDLNKDPVFEGQPNDLFSSINFKTDTSTSLIPLEEIISGGVAKDGIPSLDNPVFKSIEDSTIPDEYFGIIVKNDNRVKFYPFNILVWHEIVNDKIGNKKIAVTFCPLCGSAIVFNREIGNKIIDFGVSGLLYQSNLLMYDRKTESIWSQIEARAVIGEYAKKGAELEIIDSDVITYGALIEKYPEALVLSEETGFERDYSVYPYGDYNSSEDLVFPTKEFADTLPAKEIMYVINVGEESIAIQLSALSEFKTTEIDTSLGKVNVTIDESSGEIFATLDGKDLPGYYSMWFSWSIHHGDTGVVLYK